MSKAYAVSKEFSDTKLQELRQALSEKSLPGFTVVTYGSYARREASSQSDIDYVIIRSAEGAASEVADVAEWVRATISPIIRTAPAEDGAFAHTVDVNQILDNVGGNNDDNASITRRVLLLLEGEWLTNESSFGGIRRELITRYVDETPRDHQIALFMLNDIIRYWRTMTVDYSHKANHSSKPWAIRNIKLMFSRKLMYAGGLFSVGMTVDRRKEDKIAILESLLSVPPIDRLKIICGDQVVHRALESYGRFLAWMGEEQARNDLKLVERSDHENPLFREMKNEGHHFTRELMKVFDQTFDKTHPIHRAVLF